MKISNIIAIALPILTTTNARSLKALLSSHPKLSILHDLFDQFDLLDNINILENITIIAPTNQAYLDLANWGFNVSNVPAPVAHALLSYHILNGSYDSHGLSYQPQVMHSYLQPPILTNVTAGAAVKISKSKDEEILTESGLGVFGGVEESDLNFEGGVLHTLNSSMVLPHNITLTAEINGLTKFLELVDDVGLTETFEALKDVTVFVPTNSALKTLGGLVRMLGKKEVKRILMGHVVPDQVLYGDVLLTGGLYETMTGGKIKVAKSKDGVLRVGGVMILKQDVILYGGVAHVIDEVLVPGVAEKGRVPGRRVLMDQGYQIPMMLV